MITDAGSARPQGDAALGRGNTVKVAYLMSRFPKITETFILYEMLAIERFGIRVEVYPLRREKTAVTHAEAGAVVDRARFLPFFSWEVARAQAHFLRRRPLAYLGALATMICATLGSARFLLYGLAMFPKAVLMARRMESEGIQHMHAHFCNHPAAAAFIIHRITGIPYSVTAHGSDLHVDRHMLREKVREAAFFAPISEYNREMILREAGEEHRPKVIVLHCGVDTSVFRAEDRPPRTGPATLICIGTLHEVKGQLYLVEACRILRDAGVPLHCLLVGDGPDRAMLEGRIRKAGLEDTITLVGRRNRREIARLLQSADALIAPSVQARDGRREGIPVVLMEAMASGLPVVASRISGIPELVEHGVTGLLVAPRDAEALADAVRQLVENPELARRMGQAGRLKIEREFDLTTNAGFLAERIRAVALSNVL